MKKAGNWYSYLSGSQSTLKIHVADMKTPLLKVANHIKVCHVACVKHFFIFISIYTKMRTGSQNPSGIHFLHCCSPVAFLISPTFTRQLYSGNGRVGYTGGHCWKQERGERRSWKTGGVQVSVLKDTWKNKNGLTTGDWTWQSMVWARWNDLFYLVLIALMK